MSYSVYAACGKSVKSIRAFKSEHADCKKRKEKVKVKHSRKTTRQKGEDKMPFFNVIVTIVGLVIWIVIIALVIRVGLKFYRKISNIERNVNAILEASNEDGDSAEASETENDK